MEIRYSFTAIPWRYDGPAAWVFVSLPLKLAAEIRQSLQQEEEGWGRLKVRARTGNSEWDTAIWFDTRRKTYLLPLKASIRSRENIVSGKTVHIQLRV